MNKTDILIIHGTDYKAMTKKLLAAADLAADIGGRKKQKDGAVESDSRESLERSAGGL